MRLRVTIIDSFRNEGTANEFFFPRPMHSQNLDPFHKRIWKSNQQFKLTFTVGAVSLEPFRAVALVGAWSVGAVGVGVTRLLFLAFIDI